jgi:hypothetical protein
MRLWFSRTTKNDGKSKADTAKPYDLGLWRDVIQNDKAIAAVAENLQPLGDKWVDEFARNYLTLKDKKQAWRIVQKIISDWRETERART